MPFYVRAVTVPANTPPEEPVEVGLSVEGDILERVGFLFPPGCCCLAGIQLRYGEDLILPEEEGTWIVGDSESFWAHLSWELPEHPCPLRLLAYNEDTYYDHTIYVRVQTLHLRELEPRGLWARFLRAGLAFFERVVGVRPLRARGVRRR